LGLALGIVDGFMTKEVKPMMIRRRLAHSDPVSTHATVNVLAYMLNKTYKSSMKESIVDISLEMIQQHSRFQALQHV
jgi:hypothetical protein